MKKEFHTCQSKVVLILSTKQTIHLWRSKSLLILGGNQIIIKKQRMRCMNRWSISFRRINISKIASCRNNKSNPGFWSRSIMGNQGWMKESLRKKNNFLIWILWGLRRTLISKSLEEVKLKDPWLNKITTTIWFYKSKKNWNSNLETTCASI